MTPARLRREGKGQAGAARFPVVANGGGCGEWIWRLPPITDAGGNPWRGGNTATIVTPASARPTGLASVALENEGKANRFLQEPRGDSPAA